MSQEENDNHDQEGQEDPGTNPAIDPTLDYILTSEGDVYTFDLFCDLFSRPLTEAEFYFLLSRYPYLELCNSDASLEELRQGPYKRYQSAKTQWVIIDSGNHVVIGAGDLRLGSYEGQKGAEGGDDRGGTTGSGTLLWQGIETVHEIMVLLEDRWDEIRMLGGFYPLLRAAWMYAIRNGIEITGFSPTEEDYTILESIKTQEALSKRQIRPEKVGRGS